MKHYEAFLQIANSNLLKSLEIYSHLIFFKHSAKPIHPLINKSNLSQTFDSKLITEKINSFIREPFFKGKILPLEGVICLEDNSSVVFLQNSSAENNSLYILTCKSLAEKKTLISRGNLKYLNYNFSQDLINLIRPESILIENNTYSQLIGIEQEFKITSDLIYDATKSIEQLIYLREKDLSFKIR